MFKDIFSIILESRLNDYVIQLKDQQLANNIFSINDPKKQRIIIKWIKNNTIEYPKDIDIIDKAYEIINRKGLDYNKFNNPNQILEQYKDLNDKLEYNPDNESCFTNKVELGNNVVVYNVKDDIEGLKAVRKAVDYNWGKDSNPWCLITYPLQKALNYWKTYNKIPKRICFQNNKLIAFCASEEYKIKWWDRNNQPTRGIPIKGVYDDPNAIKEIKQLELKIYSIRNDIQNLKNSNQLKQIYQNYKDHVIIKQAIADNIYTPIYILQELSQDDDCDIRQNVVYNKNTPINILQKLSQDDSFWIKNQATRKISKIINNVSKKLEDSNNPNEFYQIYQKYKDSDSIKQILADNINTPIQILKILSQDENWIIRLKIANNKNTSIQILQKLSNDIDYHIKQTAKNKLSLK